MVYYTEFYGILYGKNKIIWHIICPCMDSVWTFYSILYVTFVDLTCFKAWDGAGRSEAGW